MWPSTCLGDVSPVLRRPAFVSPRVASVRLHLLSPCRLVRSKHIQKKMLRSTAPCYVHTKLLMIRQTRTINGLSLCSCLLKEQVQERLNSPDLQNNVVLRNLRCMATHVSGGVYIYIRTFCVKLSHLSPTKMGVLTAGSDEKRNMIRNNSDKSEISNLLHCVLCTC